MSETVNNSTYFPIKNYSTSLTNTLRFLITLSVYVQIDIKGSFEFKKFYTTKGLNHCSVFHKFEQA